MEGGEDEVDEMGGWGGLEHALIFFFLVFKLTFIGV